MSRLDCLVPPPIVLAIAIAIAWAIERMWPAGAVGRYGLAALLAAGFGLAALIAGAVSIVRARTTIDPRVPGKTTRLVTEGVFAISRNPIYLGDALILLGVVIWLGQPLAVVTLVAFIAWIDRFQIQPEERALAALFPDAFTRYAARVRRWL